MERTFTGPNQVLGPGENLDSIIGSCGEIGYSISEGGQGIILLEVADRSDLSKWSEVKSFNTYPQRGTEVKCVPTEVFRLRTGPAFNGSAVARICNKPCVL